MARRAAKRPPNGKPKLSRATSGYGGLMIPLSQVYPSQKYGCFIGVELNNSEFAGKKWAPAAGPRPDLQRGQHKNVASWVSSHESNKKFGLFTEKLDLGPKNCIFSQKFCIFFTLHLWNPLFLAQTDLIQLDHKLPISWGNSGNLRFSGRWWFGRLAGRSVALIAQSGSFWAQKRCFLAQYQFFVANLKKLLQ